MAFLGQALGVGQAQASTGANQAGVNDANSNVSNSLTAQQRLVEALQAQNGIYNQTNVFQQQQTLANQLQQQALGQGPNPAQAQLAQNTGQNIAGQAALMAGQRNSGANAGLLARQQAMQGANTQQQAVGQAATLGAQQQLAAQQALQQQQASMAGTAQNQVANQLGAQQGVANIALQSQGNQMGLSNNQNALQTGVNQNNSNAQSQLIGGLIGGGAAALMASGGKVPGQAPVTGDSPKNDIVNAKLSPGELVIPRSVVMQGPDAVLAFAKQHLEEDGE